MSFGSRAVSRRRPQPERAWPLGDAVETPPVPPADVARALDAFAARSTGAYCVLIAAPERILCERYSEFGSAGNCDPELVSMPITCTMIGRLILEGWLACPVEPCLILAGNSQGRS